MSERDDCRPDGAATVEGALADVPSYARSSDRLAAAWAYARDAHNAEGETVFEHPAATAQILHAAGYPEHVVVAALLHDVVEDTSASLAELRDRFGAQVCALVARVTEDGSIASYRLRKAELRRRAVDDLDGHAAAIFAADKLASVRAHNARGTVPEHEKLEHYAATLRALEAHHPDIPFLPALASELDRLERTVAASGGRDATE